MTPNPLPENAPDLPASRSPDFPPANIVLTGFMGVGKTAAGRETAARLRRPFVDMDAVIAARAGLSIPEIFRQQGEAAFRALENDLVRELAGQRGLVIATGGGALVDATNRQRMARTGLVICLTAGVDDILARVGGEEAGERRPLLAGADARARVSELLERRAAAYAEIPFHIDASGRSLTEVTDEVIALAAREPGGLLRLPVRTPDGGYHILLGRGLLPTLPRRLAEAGLAGRVAVITDEAVAPDWAGAVATAFAAAGRAAQVIVLPAGERHKNLATVAAIYDRLIEAGIDRQGVVVALGGGVIGDMAGFAAATYLRGVAFVQVPTTLLAMVDASVGGKVGVDLPQGKNLVGAFKQPGLVLIDPDLLASLPASEFRNGLAEVVKHGLIADADLFAQLEAEGPESLESLLAGALRVKIGVVERDPFEQGERAYLNLGHTFGHAFEQVSGYTLPHGQGVALGLIAAAELAAARQLCPPDLPARIASLLDRLGLPTRLSGVDPAAVLAAMATDKKREAGRLRFVLPHAIGRVALHDDVAPAEVLAALAPILAPSA
jgi:3-dehydroquinate synthase